MHAIIRKALFTAQLIRGAFDLALAGVVRVQRFSLFMEFRQMDLSTKFWMVEDAPTPVGPFSHATEQSGWVFLTGQMPTSPHDDDAPLPEGVAAQTTQVIDNLILVLKGIGLGLEHVVSVRIFLTEFKRDYATMNKVYAAYFPPGKLPARTCIGVTGLARDALVEIDFIAHRPTSAAA